jgi:hypothetical protein
VGINSQTNDADEAVSILSKTFPEYRVTPINLCPFESGNSSPVFLRSVCSVGGSDRIIVGGEIGQFVSDAIESASPGLYSFTHLPTSEGANCILVNGHLLRPLSNELDEESDRILTDSLAVDQRQIPVPTKEFSKLGSGLSSCCILFNSLAIDNKVI